MAPHFDPDCMCVRCHSRRLQLRFKYAARGWMDRQPDTFRIEIDGEGVARARPVTLTDQLEELDVRGMWELRHDVRGDVS